jgi:hypothetical protein
VRIRSSYIASRKRTRGTGCPDGDNQMPNFPGLGLLHDTTDISGGPASAASMPRCNLMGDSFATMSRNSLSIDPVPKAENIIDRRSIPQSLSKGSDSRQVS